MKESERIRNVVSVSIEHVMKTKMYTNVYFIFHSIYDE